MDFLRRWLVNPLAVQMLTALAALVAIVVLAYLARRAVTHFVTDPSSRYRARKFVTFSAYVVVLLMLSIVFRNRLMGLTIVFGAASAGIAFALREVILSVAGWMTITFGGLYAAGDRIQVAGVSGDVIDVSILRTTLMEIGEWVASDLYTGRTVRVANSFVFQQPVYNYSGDYPFLWDEIKVPVRYGGDRKLARDILERTANEVVADYVAGAELEWDSMLRRFRLEPARVQPMVTLVATDNWLEFTVRYVVDYKKRRITKDLLFTRILDEFDKTDGRVRIASETHDIVGFPDVSVNVKGDGPLRRPAPSDDS